MNGIEAADFSAGSPKPLSLPAIWCRLMACCAPSVPMPVPNKDRRNRPCGGKAPLAAPHGARPAGSVPAWPRIRHRRRWSARPRHCATGRKGLRHAAALFRLKTEFTQGGTYRAAERYSRQAGSTSFQTIRRQSDSSRSCAVTQSRASSLQSFIMISPSAACGCDARPATPEKRESRTPLPEP